MIRGLDAKEAARDKELRDFINELDAGLLTAARTSNGSDVELYRAGARIFIVWKYANGGFEILIPACDTIKTQETFDAVRKYVNS